MTPLLNPVVKTASLSTQVFEKIREAIFAGELQPGDPLRELHLAQELRVSQATIREALTQLERLGLVRRVPNKGTTVSKLSRKDIQDRFAVRLVLEHKAFVEAALRMTEREFAELNERSEGIARAVNGNAYYEAALADLEFHRFVWEQADNPVLYEMLDQLVVPLFAFLSILRRSDLENLKDHDDPHEQLVAALKSRDAEAIEAALRGHYANCEWKIESSLPR